MSIYVNDLEYTIHAPLVLFNRRRVCNLMVTH